MAARLTTTLYVSALIRAAGAKGGFGAVLKKGDPDAGSVLLITREKTGISGAFEPQLAHDGRYRWARVADQVSENKENFEDMVNRRQSRDPDLWVIELDIPDAERFIADYPRQA